MFKNNSEVQWKIVDIFIHHRRKFENWFLYRLDSQRQLLDEANEGQYSVVNVGDKGIERG